jgi:mannose-6-phosphate isomerase-like protein (cupin superfamily)
MIELAPQIQIAPEPIAADVRVHELAPLQPLPVRDEEQTLRVSEGVLYVVLDEDELALTPGDEIHVRRGELQRAWNAGDDRLRVVTASCG